jgi:mono/diheme cytochrome c family protein
MFRVLPLILLMILSSCSEPDISYPQRRIPAGLNIDIDRLAIAQQFFIRHCANCHGTLSEGRMSRADFFQPAAPDFTSYSYQQTDPAYLFWRVSEGKMVEPFLSQGSVMPGWGAHLSEEEIWVLVAYLQTRSGY